jgi:hypothetical protein
MTCLTQNNLSILRVEVAAIFPGNLMKKGNAVWQNEECLTVEKVITWKHDNLWPGLISNLVF